MDNLMCFEGNQVEMMNVNGEWLFEVYSTGMALGYVKFNSAGKAYARKERIDETIKNAEISPCVHGGHKYFSESQLYDFMLEAKTEKVKPFRKWLVNEVLPSINHTGTYIMEKQPRQLELEDKPYQYQPKKYKGIPVVTTADLEHFTSGKADSIAYQVRKRKGFFQYGVDYWLLQGVELAEFKIENIHWRSAAKKLLLFTQSGVGKLSRLIYGIPQELSWLEIKPENKVKELACMQEQKDIDNYSETVKSFLVKSFLEIQGTEVQLMQLMSDIIENPEDRSKERAIYFSSLSLMLGLFKQTVKCFSEFA